MIKDENKRIQITVSPDTLSKLDYLRDLYGLNYSQVISLCVRFLSDPESIAPWKPSKLDCDWIVVPTVTDP